MGWDWNRAIGEMREALRLDPGNADAHANLGWALAHQGDWDAAIAELREALRLDPKNPDAHANLGTALAKKGDLAGAVGAYRQARTSSRPMPVCA